MVQRHNKTAIVYKDISYSYDQLLQYSSLYAQFFSQEKQPKKVLIFSENLPQWYFAFYGVLSCNAICVPVDVQSTQKELAYIIEDCQPDIIFASKNKLDFVTKSSELVDDFQGTIVTAEDIDDSEVDKIEPKEITVQNPEQTILLIYTSGTTGSPKGVMLSYKNVMFVANAVSQDVPIYNKDSNIMVLLPLHHSFPLQGTLIIPMCVGSTVYIAEGVNSESILRTLNDGKISIIIGVPRLYDTLTKSVMDKINSKLITRLVYKMMKFIGSDALSKIVFKSVHNIFGGHIKYLVSGGAALSIETATIFKTLGFYVLEGYGMTEAAPMISFTHPGKRKIGYTGYPLKGMDVKISPSGEICVKGDNVMQGYYNHPEATSEIIVDEWLHTGDVGFLDKYGLKITGRIKEIIVTPNGKNINPEEVEKELLAVAAYMKEAAVFMEKDVLQAIVIPQLQIMREGEIENMRDFIKEDIAKYNKEAPSYRRIKQFHITSQELPRTRLGKIQRFKLSAFYTQQQEKKVDENIEEQSHIYKLLKTFVDSETGYNAAVDDHFEIDLSMDSLSRVALLSFVETTFGLTLNEEQLENLNTLAKLSQFIEQNSNEINNKEVSWKEILYSKLPDFKIPETGFIHQFFNGLSKIMFHITYRFKSKGEKNFPNEPYIIVANHRSGLDSLIITAKLNHKMTRNTFVFAKAKHLRTRFLRFMAGKNNVIIMDINKNVKESLQQMSYILRQGKNVIIFPEGTRSINRELKHFKETFAILSMELNIPILPVVITGSEGAVTHPGKFPRFFAPIHVEFLDLIHPNFEQSIETLRERVENAIKSKLNEK